MTRERTVQVFVAALCVIALVAIIAVTSGSEIDETTGRVMLSAVTVSVFLLFSLAGNALRETEEAWSWLGWVSIAFCLAAAMALLGLIWSDDGGDESWEPATVFSVFALVTSHASLLLKHVGDRNDAGALARYATFGCGLLIAAWITWAVIADFEGDTGDEQIFAVLGILYLLGTIVSPLLRLGESSEPSGADD